MVDRNGEELSEIKAKGKLCVSDSIRFIKIDQVIIDIFGLRKNDGTKYKRGYFNMAKAFSESQKMKKFGFLNSLKIKI